LRRYDYLNFFQDGDGRHLRFVRTGNNAIRSAIPENATPELNMKCIGSPVVEIWPFAYIGDIWIPILGKEGRIRGSAMAPFERQMVVSYYVTIALSVTILPQFAIAIECHSPTLKSTGVGHWGQKFRSVPLRVDP